MRLTPIVAACLLLAACEGGNGQPSAAPASNARSAPSPDSPVERTKAPEAVAEPPVDGTVAKASVPPANNPCRMQDDAPLEVRPTRAIGTEPFWNAQVDGRCVTYADPENQSGTRIWARYQKNGKGETWTGAFQGKPFELRSSPQPGCSDGMSDKIYPIAVQLRVSGEVRNGCAEPT